MSANTRSAGRTQRANPYQLEELFVKFHRTPAGIAWRWRAELAIAATLAAILWRLSILITLTWAGLVLAGPGQDYQPPPPGIDAAMLSDAIGQAAAAVRLTVAASPGTAVTLTFGAPQGTDVRPIRCDDLAGTGQPLNHQAVANYIAKYATKTLIAPGLPPYRLRHHADIEDLRCSAHHRRMITTAWQLGSRRATGQARFRTWAHMLGYGGHFLTKSRRYSVTFSQLRKARAHHRRAERRAERHPGGERDPWGRPLDETIVLVISTWAYAGTGYTAAAADVQLALASAARAREYRCVAM